MSNSQINIGEILNKVKSKYLLVMITAKRSRQLSLLEQKDTILNLDPEKLKGRTDLEKVGTITDEEKVNLKQHKPILVALNEMQNDKITYKFNEDK
ncbi:MAG: DNA-directed RNA polymerase subunit omega [Fusobacteria bacterium]|nr:DNA-directed RNA polymerase subunit omega [Fusobacteriota bacterium]